MRELIKVFLNRIIFVMMNYFSLISQTHSTRKSTLISTMLTHSLFNSSRIIFKFCSIILQVLLLTKIFHNLVIIKSWKTNKINTIWKMKTEEDKLYKESRMRRLKTTYTPFKTIRILAFRNIIITITKMSLRQYRQRILRVHADGCKWMRTKRCNIEELIINKFKKDNKGQGRIHLIWTAAKSVLELLINLSCKCHPVQHS